MCQLFESYNNFTHPDTVLSFCKTLHDITDHSKTPLINLLDFEDQNKILYDFIWNGELFDNLIHRETVCFIQTIWHKKEFKKHIRVLKCQLRHFWRSRLNPEIQYTNGKTKCQFWYLCALYPLLGDQGLNMFKDVSTIEYDDVYLWMFSTLNFIDPDDHFEYIKKILLYWSTNGNIKFSIESNKMLASLLMNWTKMGFDYSVDDEFMALLERESIIRYIKSKKFEDKNNISGHTFNKLITGEELFACVPDLEEDIVNDRFAFYTKDTILNDAKLSFTTIFKKVTIPDDADIIINGQIFNTDKMIVSGIYNLEDIDVPLHIVI
jgi:hypothetical protein